MLVNSATKGIDPVAAGLAVVAAALAAWAS
jgi:hypothetical protein